jgi:hypothetical protein
MVRHGRLHKKKKLKELLEPTPLGKKIKEGVSSAVDYIKDKAKQNQILIDQGYRYDPRESKMGGGGSSWDGGTDGGGGSTWGNTPQQSNSKKKTVVKPPRYLVEPKQFWTGSEESIKSDIIRRQARREEEGDKIKGYKSNSGSGTAGSSALSSRNTNTTKTTSLSKPTSWGEEGSQDFKDAKKQYNQWYYQQHKDYWVNYAKGIKSRFEADAKRGQDLANTQKTKDHAMGNMAMQEAYKRAGEARGQAMGNIGKTSVSDASSSGSTSFGSRIINQITESAGKTSFASLWKSGINSIISAGKSFLSKIFG